jgi:large subunit ribosomal protein L29
MSKARVELEKIRDLPDDELVQALDRARDELFRLQLGNYTNQVENTMSVRGKRRELARILTVMRNRSLGSETQTERGREQAAAATAGAEEPAAKPRKTKKKKEG